MNKYQVFEISKNGKRIIQSDLTLEKAESLSQEVAKTNLENVYGYEPVYKDKTVKVIGKADSRIAKRHLKNLLWTIDDGMKIENQNMEECKVAKSIIEDILTKYENFYKGGSGYTFQVSADDFNELVNHIKWLEHLNNELKYNLKTCKEDVCELEKEIEEHCETKGLVGRQVFALTKRVDELIEENKGLKILIEAERGFYNSQNHK